MLSFHISNKRQEPLQFEHRGGPVELGRGPQRGDVPRCAIADPAAARDHVRIEQIGADRIRVENLSDHKPVRFADNTVLAPGDVRELGLPVILTVGETVIDIEPGAEDEGDGEGLESIEEPVQAGNASESQSSVFQLDGAPSPETLFKWFETIVTVQRAAAGSPEFHQQTARALVDLIGLDRGLVLLGRGDAWEVAARAGGASKSEQEFSQTVLRHVVQHRKTFYQSATGPVRGANLKWIGSLEGVEAVVASPLLDPRARVIGALYGARGSAPGTYRSGIGPLESRLVQVLASAAGAGLARLEKEAEAARLRVQFEQFFSSELALELERNPGLLEGQEREVTVMFSDIRGFSRLSERLHSRDACRLVADVMERLTARIRQYEGVVVDYLGDGLLAMWNAPKDIPDHPALACQAAQAMLAEMPALSVKWQTLVGGPLRIGVGLNTGLAMVGNTGNRHKFKYGPLGHTVNLASRVEGATKQVGVPVLITGSTRARLGNQFATRRLRKVRVVGIDETVDLYELHHGPADAAWLAHRDAYEKALALYEEGRWAAACQGIYSLLSQHESHYDAPSLSLGSRAAECLNAPPAKFDPVMDLSSK